MDKQKEIERMAEIICEAYIPKQKPQEERYGDIYKFMPTATSLINAGYRLCGGDNCPNYKHYQAECERCTKKMEIKKALEIDAVKEQAVREFAEKLERKVGALTVADDETYWFRCGFETLQEHLPEIIKELVKEVCGE